MQQLNVRVDDDLAQWVRVQAASEGKLPRDVVERALHNERIRVAPLEEVVEQYAPAEPHARHGCPNCGADMSLLPGTNDWVCPECQTSMSVS